MTGPQVAGSFRDPSGFVFVRDGILYRQVNRRHLDAYELLASSGLYENLVSNELLVPHEEVSVQPASPDSYKVIRPERVSFISYPYEWCFGQLRDAALATLAIQNRAIDKGMSLRDASAYNIQFRNGKPVLIDTLSLEQLSPGAPWVAYGQFCQHFLAPLALMAYRDAALSGLLRAHMDGVPLGLASQLLPKRTRLRPSLALHIHAHAKSQKRHAGDVVSPRGKGLSMNALRGLIASLESAISKLRFEPEHSTWGDYYKSACTYAEASLQHKAELVSAYIERVSPASLWDLGGNTGLFSRLGSGRGIPTVSFDVDPVAVEANYHQMRQAGELNLLPLVLDLTNPSPALGWAGEERSSLEERGPVDLVMALALVHHVAIGNNVPLQMIASYVRRLGSWLIIEFVPKHDAMAQRLLASREDVFDGYTQEGFETAFSGSFTIEAREAIKDTDRTLYLMQGR